MAFFSGGDAGGGSLWSQGSLFNTSNPVIDILEKEDFSLQELLEQDELLQEVKAQNTKLIDFLAKESSVTEMIAYLTQPALADASDMRVHKYPYMSCELICCDVPELIETLVSRASPATAGEEGGAEEESGELFRGLFALLDTEGPIDLRLAGYFEKVFTLLHQRKGLELTAALNDGGIELFGRFAKHLESMSIMECVRKMMQPAPVDLYAVAGGFAGGFGSASPANEGAEGTSYPSVCWLEDKRVVWMLLDVLGGGSLSSDSGDDSDAARATLDARVGAAAEHAAELLLHIVISASSPGGGVAAVWGLEAEMEAMGLGAGGAMGNSDGDGDKTPPTSLLFEELKTSKAASRIAEIALPEDGPALKNQLYASPSPLNAALMLLETLVSCCCISAEDKQAQPIFEADGTEADAEGATAGSADDSGAVFFSAIAARVSHIERCLVTKGTGPRCTLRLQTLRDENPSAAPRPSLGIGRLKVVELVVVLVQCRSPALEAQLVKHAVLPRCIELFFEFPWNNLLHSLVEHAVIAVVEGGSEPLQRSVLDDACLVRRVIDTYKLEGECSEKRHAARKSIAGSGEDTAAAAAALKTCRAGNLGHVNRIANLVLAATEALEREGAAAKDSESGSVSQPKAEGEGQEGVGLTLPNDAMDDDSMGFTSASVAAVRFARLVRESKDSDEWETFAGTALAEQNCVESMPLGGAGSGDLNLPPSPALSPEKDGDIWAFDSMRSAMDAAGEENDGQAGDADADEFDPRTFSATNAFDGSDEEEDGRDASHGNSSSDEEDSSFERDLADATEATEHDLNGLDRATADTGTGNAADDDEWNAFDATADAIGGSDFANFGDVGANAGASTTAESGAGSDPAGKSNGVAADSFAAFGDAAFSADFESVGADGSTDGSSGTDAAPFDPFANFGTSGTPDNEGSAGTT